MVSHTRIAHLFVLVLLTSFAHAQTPTTSDSPTDSDTNSTDSSDNSTAPPSATGTDMSGRSTTPAPSTGKSSAIPSTPTAIPSTLQPSSGPSAVSPSKASPVGPSSNASANVSTEPSEAATTTSSTRGDAVTDAPPRCNMVGRNFAPPFLQCVEVGCKTGEPCKSPELKGDICCPYSLGWNTINCCLKTNFNKPPHPYNNNYQPPYYRPNSVDSRLPMYPQPPYSQGPVPFYQPSPFAAGRPVPYPPNQMHYPNYPYQYPGFR